ncbi:MAG TPA: thioesterase family protein [Burkholderiaceae bacterium]
MPDRPSTPSAPAARRSPAEQARFEAILADMFEQRIAFNQVLGLKVAAIGAQSSSLRFDMRPELVGHFLYGRLHGGVISATLDATAGLALMAAMAERHAADTADQVVHRFSRLGTIDLRVDFLRQGVGKHFVATGEVTRLGGRVGSVLMKLVNDDGVLIATGAAAYMVA